MSDEPNDDEQERKSILRQLDLCVLLFASMTWFFVKMGVNCLMGYLRNG